ncbi:MAG: tyrosine-type recombinase/integrase [Deltaproteobacteria bacterium]
MSPHSIPCSIRVISLIQDRNKSLWRTEIALGKVNASEIDGMLVKEIKNADLEKYKAKRSEEVRPATIDHEIGELQDLLKSIPRPIHDQHVFLYKDSPLSDIRAGLETGCEAAGIQYGRYNEFSFHTLRHTFKTDCRGAGIADHVSEAIMSHSDGNSMSKRYDEVTDQDRLDAIGGLEAVQVLDKTLVLR